MQVAGLSQGNAKTLTTDWKDPAFQYQSPNFGGSMFHKAPVGIYVADHRGQTLYVNSKYEEISGLNSDEVIGRHLEELIQAGVYDCSATLQVLKHRHPVRIQQTIRGRIPVTATGSPVMDNKGHIRYVITIVQPRTPKRNQEKSPAESAPILTSNQEMKTVLADAARAASFDIPVLIEGATGTGKELLAQWIHTHSPRKKGPLIRLNAASLSENLLDAELFGYAPGSFTGARKEGKQGLLEAASGGTLFLDEIGDMSLSAQVNLLRTLETRTFRRMGDTQERSVDIRLICATNRDLETMMKRGEFRIDFYHRIDGIRLHLPELARRTEDIQPLARHFWNQLIEQHGVPKTLCADLSLLEQVAWPGSIRELRNFVQKLYVLSDTEVTQESLSLLLKRFGKVPESAQDFKSQVRAFEVRLLQDTIQQEGSINGAAQKLGIDRSTIFRKLRNS